MYVNGLLAPDVYLVRGRSYVFVVETGLGGGPRGTFHPLYLTSDSAGGYQAKTEFQKKASIVSHTLSVCICGQKSRTHKAAAKAGLLRQSVTMPSYDHLQPS